MGIANIHIPQFLIPHYQYSDSVSSMYQKILRRKA